MSADNGIYILNLKDQSRVIHAQAIDNLWWSFLDFNSAEDFVPTRIFQYYNNALPLTKEEAQKKAFEMEHEILSDDFCPILEYGICDFDIDKTWEELVWEAKELAPKEIASIKAQDDWDRKKDWYKPEIKMLKEIINS